MKRRLFFWFEKLKISQNERRAIFLLLMLLSTLVLVNAVVSQRPSFSSTYYAALDKEFKARTAQMKKHQRQLMKRYRGEKARTAIHHAASKDSVKTKKDAPKPKANPHALINVNTANAKLLQRLHGIGPAYARHIIKYRKIHGPFKTKDALKKVKGIGKKRLANIKPFIKLRGK